MGRLVGEREELEARREAAEIAREDMEVQLQDTVEALEASEASQQQIEAAEVELRSRVEELTAAISKASAEHAEELRRTRSECEELRRQAALLRDTTAVGAKQAEVDLLAVERDTLSAALQELRAELETVALERDALAERLVELDRGIGAEVELRVVTERETNLLLERRLHAAEERLAQELERAKAQENERRLLSAEIDELTRWKAVYESGHGLQELARSQRKVKEDNRRLGVALEQITKRLGEAIDGNSLLLQALERLKRETGREDFVLEEEELRKEMLGETAALRSQVLEMETQIEALEAETVRVRRALKNQAGALGEQGFRFAGMDADMLVQVNEFATALREGRKVSSEPRASELLKQNRKLKEELAELKLRLELLERETGGGIERGSDGSAHESLLRGLREDVRRVVDENGELRSRISQMQEELLVTIGNRTSEMKGGTTDGVAAMLIANNEILLRQIHELKLQAASHSVKDSPETDDVSIPESHPAAHIEGSPFVDSFRRSTGLPPSGRRQVFAGTPPRGFLSRSGILESAASPYTASGKALLSRTLAGLNLPPEEWADEVKELNGQLVECIEALFEREAELNEQSIVTQDLERNLVKVKQQLAVLYNDYRTRKEEWSSIEKQLRSENASASAERDDLRLRIRRAEETIALLEKEDSNTIEVKLRELSRKLAIYEVNEAVLARRYTAQKEQLQLELRRREDIELEKVQLETTLKRRILYLEQAKCSLSSKVDRLEALLSQTVPVGDFRAIHLELETLRQDHLETLRREVESRISLLKMHGDASTLNDTKFRLQQLEAELAASHDACDHLRKQLDDQRALTQRTASAAASPAELARITAESTRFRVEVSRLEVELAGARRDITNLGNNLDAALIRERQLVTDVETHKRNEENALSIEREMRKQLSDIKLHFEGGLARDEADVLRAEREKFQAEMDNLRFEVVKLKELADIAVKQSTAISRNKQLCSDEISELMDYCSRVESKGDDELIIGRLQRQLSSTKTSYRLFASKYHALRTDMHQRELVIRAMERRLDERDAEAFALRRNHSVDLSIVRKALTDLESGEGSRDVTRMGMRLSEVSRRIGLFSQLTDTAVCHTLELEEQKRLLAGALSDLEHEREIFNRRCDDLKMVIDGDEKKRELARRLVDLSEEVRTSLLKAMQQGREVAVLGQEKRYLHAIVASLESNLKDLEEAKARAAAQLIAPQGSELLVDNEKGIATLQELLYSDPLLPDIPSAKVNEYNGKLSSDELLARLQSASEKVMQVQREAEEVRLRGERRLFELEKIVASQAEKIEHYEDLLRQEGFVQEEAGGIAKGRPLKQIDTHGIIRSEQARVQEAASATIGSLQALIQEKNETIDRLRERLELLSVHRPRSHADLNAETLLAEKDIPPGISSDFPGIIAPDTEFQRRLLSQVEEAESLIEERNKTIAQLEAHLARQSNARERAEVRCGDALAEMEAMRKDMMTLVQQLREAQEGRGRFNSARKTQAAIEVLPSESKNDGPETTEPPKTNRDLVEKKNVELKKAIRAKDEKIRGYREIIVRLKDEFIKAEEERALNAQKQQDRSNKETNSSVGREEMQELKAQVAALKDGLRTAKQDLEAAKKTREKLTRARMAAQEEQEKMDAQLSRAEAQAASAMESLTRVRKELEESRRREAQLRSKLKESTEESVNDSVLQDKIQGMRKEIDLLKAQNEALRKESSSGGRRERILSKPLEGAQLLGKKDEGGNVEKLPPPVAEPKRIVQETKVENVKATVTPKLENEKRFEKRITILETRLKEKVVECEDLQRQVTSLKSIAQSSTPREKRVRDEGRQMSDEMVHALEDSRRRIFELEDSNNILRRRCEVEFPNEIAALRFQLSALQREAAERASTVEEKGVEAGDRTEGVRSLRERYVTIANTSHFTRYLVKIGIFARSS